MTFSKQSLGGTTRATKYLFAVISILLLQAVATTASARTIYYHGVVVAPEHPESGPHYGNTTSGLTYSANCFGKTDPSDKDGFPGCFGLLGNANHAPIQFGAFSLEKPVTIPAGDQNIRHIPKQVKRGEEVIKLLDPSIDKSGRSIHTRLKETAKNWTNRQMTGVAALADGSVLHTCGRDWYNTANTTFPSHCLADNIGTDKAAASGPFAFRCPPGYRNLCHGEMVGAYVGSITDQAYADKVFATNGFSKPGQEICLTGDMRAHGVKKTRSQGFALYAFRCADLRKTSKGPIDAMPLMHHPSNRGNLNDNSNANLVKWPRYSSPYKWSPTNTCGDISWGKMPSKDPAAAGTYEQGLFVACSFGGQVWWYGTSEPWKDANAARGVGPGGRERCKFNGNNPSTDAGVDCSNIFASLGDPIPKNFSNPCGYHKGYHGVASEAPYRRSVLLFYRAEDIAKSAALTFSGDNQQHLDNVPFDVVLDTPQQTWERECAGFNGVAFDPANNRLFVMEDTRFTPIIHVFSM